MYAQASLLSSALIAAEYSKCREFTHRVKSISVAKFTSQEVSALQEGGNERAKEIYFKRFPRAVCY
uniref:NIG n=1 Tax=Arundo donax TaxID=35708 RepID=A0A0A9GDK0_ARUDO